MTDDYEYTDERIAMAATAANVGGLEGEQCYGYYLD